MLNGQQSVIKEIRVEAALQEKWKRLLDLAAGMLQIPALLFIRARDEETEIIAGGTEAGDYSGEACLRVGSVGFNEIINAIRRAPGIPNMLKDDAPCNSASAVSIAYLGFPVLRPDGEVFGAVCALCKGERQYAERDEKLLALLAETLQDDLAAVARRADCEKEAQAHNEDAMTLCRSEERYRKVFQTSVSPIVIADSKGCVIEANASFLTLFGFAHDAVIGKKITELGINGFAEHSQEIRDMLSDGPLENYPLTMKTPTGENRQMLVSIEAVPITEQQCFITTLTDITPVKRLEQSLQTVNERFSLAIHAAEIGIWDYDLARESLYLDAQVARIYGLGDRPMTTTHTVWISCIHPDDIARCKADTELALSNLTLDSEHRIVRPDGDVRYVKSFGDVICGADGVPKRVVGVSMDITQKSVSALALQISEARLKRAQELAHVGNWEVDLNASLMWASKEAFRIYGLPYKTDSIPLEEARRSVFGEDRPMMDEALENLIRSDANYDVVFRIQHQNDAQVRTLHSVAEVMRGSDGKPVRVVGVVQDISEMMQAQQRIAESEQAYRALFNENPAVHLVLDIDDGRIIDANPAAVHFYGYAHDELTGKPISEINGLSPEEAVNNLRLAYQRKRVCYEASHRLSDGSRRDVEAFVGPVDIGGRQCVHGIVHDITDRKRAEIQVRESEARFRQYVESAPDGVFVQTDARFQYVNRRTLEILGVKTETELMDQPILEFFAEDCREKVNACVKTLNEMCQPVPTTEGAILRMDGTVVEIEVSAVPIRYKEKNGALVFMRDITSRRALENEKMEMQTQLQQKQRLESIGLLAGGVAHEINNPLNGIINYAQLIFEGQTDEVPEYSREIIREGQRIGEIVRNLLKFSRQEKQSHSPARIEDIVNETLSLIRTLMRHDQITLEIDIPPDLPSIKCRSQQIQQVIMNLLTNARDALNTRYKGFDENKVIRVNCILFERGGRRWIRLSVEDHGTGIPDAIRDKVFDPFFTTKPRDQGTGLGLSISHGIVKDHHGELYFETEPGAYTRAQLELPVDNGWNLTED